MSMYNDRGGGGIENVKTQVNFEKGNLDNSTCELLTV